MLQNHLWVLWILCNVDVVLSINCLVANWSQLIVIILELFTNSRSQSHSLSKPKLNSEISVYLVHNWINTTHALQTHIFF